MVLKNRDVLKAQRKAKKGLKAVSHPAISKLWDSKKSPSSNHTALGLMSYGLNRITPSGGSALDSSSPHPDAAPASAAVLSAHSAGFEVGTRIVIRGLKAQPEFNGCAGEIVSPEENGRWGVVLDQGDGIKVRTSNMENCVIALQQAVSAATYEVAPIIQEGEAEFLVRAFKKYGHDYDAMASDIKLNAYQHTAAQLRRKFARAERLLKQLKA